MKITASVFAIANKGAVRKENQDNLYLNGYSPNITDMQEPHIFKLEYVTEPFIFAICDGMGEEAEGAEAAHMAASSIKDFHEALTTGFYGNIQKYIDTVNGKICEIKDLRGHRSGTTIAMICSSQYGIVCANMGDSRIYRYRGGELLQISEDHNQGGLLKKMGIENKNNTKGKLTLHFGIPPEEMALEPFCANIDDVKENDIFLLCSDGLTDMLDDGEIAHIIKDGNNIAGSNTQEICVSLANTALNNGGYDNITLAIMKIKSVNGDYGNADRTDEILRKEQKKKKTINISLHFTVICILLGFIIFLIVNYDYLRKLFDLL